MPTAYHAQRLAALAAKADELRVQVREHQRKLDAEEAKEATLGEWNCQFHGGWMVMVRVVAWWMVNDGGGCLVNADGLKITLKSW